jgi:hypothetical protein
MIASRLWKFLLNSGCRVTAVEFDMVFHDNLRFPTKPFSEPIYDCIKQVKNVPAKLRKDEGYALCIEELF